MTEPSSSQLPPTPPVSPSARRGLLVAGTGVLVAVSLGTALFTTRKHSALSEARQALQGVASEGTPILAAPVGQSAPTRQIFVPGELRAYQSVTVYAKLSGYLNKMLVDKGDHVKKGQVIARVGSPETDMQVVNAEAAYRLAKQTEARYRALLPSGTVSQQEVDQATAARRSAQAALNTQLAIKSYEVIRAPYDGVITARYTDGGVLLSAATTSTQSALPLVEVQDMTKLRLTCYVGQAEAPFVRAGDKVQITSREMPELHLQTEVTRISEALDAHTRTMLVEVEIDNYTGKLKPGQYVQVALQVAVPPAVTVPIDAIFLRNGMAYVAVIEQNVARYTPVRTGLNDGRSVQVLEGLEAGQHVGLHMGDAISDGAHVRMIEPHRAQVPKQE